MRDLDQKYDPPTREQLTGDVPGISLADDGHADHGPYVIFRAVCGADGYFCSASFRDSEGYGGGATPREALRSLAKGLRNTAERLERAAEEDPAITADNITDEQIRELMIECRRAVALAAPVRHDMNGSEAIVYLGVCEVALGIRRNRHGKDQKATARARCAEILNARTPRCDYRAEHDALADMPVGNRCKATATHRIEWEDGRYSYGCDAHLEIDEAATVKPVRVVPIGGAR